MMANKHKGCTHWGTYPNTLRHELTKVMHHICPRSRKNPSLSRGFAECQDLIRFFLLHQIKPHALPLVQAPVNSFEFHARERTPQAGCLTCKLQLNGSRRTMHSIHCLQLGLLGYLIPLALLIFVSHFQCWPSRVLSSFVFFSISTHFTTPPRIPSAPTVHQLCSFHRLSMVEPWDLMSY